VQPDNFAAPQLREVDVLQMAGTNYSINSKVDLFEGGKIG
jgi:hypothetical protein